jgi:hypothetical protein
MKVKIIFSEECLGTMAADPKVHEEFIASQAPDAASREEEIASLGVEAVVAKQMTLFPRENDKPFLWDYQIKGFFKEACGMISRIPGNPPVDIFGHHTKKIKAFRKIIDGLIFVYPRKILLELPTGGVIGSCQRPLRINGPQGERVALANSETVPIGTFCIFEIKVLGGGYDKAIEEWLDYGKFKGLLQWRNSGKGRFTWEKIED